MFRGLKLVNQTISAAFPPLGVTVLDSDFINNVSSMWAPIADKITDTDGIAGSLDIEALPKL